MKLLEKHFEIALETPDGITRLRELILKLAMHGKLVKQIDLNPDDQILKLIELGKTRLFKESKINNTTILAPTNERDYPYKLPKNWKWVRLGNVAAIVGGGTPKTNISKYWSESEIPWITPADLYKRKDIYIDKGKRFITQSGLKESSTQLLPTGSVLFSSRAPIGYVAICKNPIATNQGFKSCVPYLKEMNLYIYYFLKFSAKKIDENASGTTFKEVSGKIVNSLLFPLPPLEEQKRIVEKIEQLMLLCDKLEAERNRKNKLQLQINSAAINNLINDNGEISFNDTWSFIIEQFDTLYTVKQNVTDLKDAIINLAIKGKLISKDLKSKVEQDIEIDIISSSKFKINGKEYPFLLPKGWKWLALNDVGLTQTGTTPATKNSEYYGDYIPFIGPGDIKNQIINYTNLSLTELGLKKARLIPIHSIMMVCIGGSIGKLAINDRDVTCNQQINTITPYYNIDLKYLFAVLQSSYFQNQIVSNSSGSATPIINKQKWISIPIPVPPYEVQKVISNKVDELFKLCDMLEKNIEESSKKQSQIFNAVLAQV